MRTFEEVGDWGCRLVAAAQARGVSIRIFGSVAVWLHCPLTREEGAFPAGSMPDLDVVTRSGDRARVYEVLEGFGLVPDADLESVPGLRQAIFYPRVRGTHGTRVDVRFNDLEFAHRIPIGDRLEVDSPTIPLAELLLSKLQIRAWKRRDELDLENLLAEHALGPTDRDEINEPRIARLCAGDWGLTRTVLENLARLIELKVATPDAGSRARALGKAVIAHPKMPTWYLRAAVGQLMPHLRWYADVEDVGQLNATDTDARA